MIHNFTAWDASAVSIVFLLFTLFLVVPGYVLGAWLDIFAFDRRTLLARIAISVSLSIAVVPIATYLCWLSVPAVPWLVCAASWVALPVVLARHLRRRDRRSGRLSKPRVIVLAILAGWVVVGAFCLIDIQIGHRLYFPINSYDDTFRAAATAAIDRTGVPPTNPYFYPGHGYLLRYHYFWYMLCSLVERFGGHLVTARIAVLGGTLWSGIALAAIVSLYVHFFRSTRPENPDKQTLVAIALLGVTGLDILPFTITFVLSGRFNASSEWWNEPVLSWANSVFWQPHSIVALIACLTGLLIMRSAARRSETRARISGAAVGGAALASSLGLSVYITFVFGIFLAVWVIWLLFRRRWPEVRITCVAAILSLVLSIPYLLELSGKRSARANEPVDSVKSPIGFSVRSFPLAEAFVGEPGNHWEVPLLDLVMLPLNYFLEFGIFFVVGIKQWRRMRCQRELSDEDACGIAMVVTSMVICTFLRSNVIANNDLGWRGIAIAQFVLLIWAAELWENGLFTAKRSLFSGFGVMLALGAAATVYDVTMLRIYPILLDDLAIPRYAWLAPDHHLGERTYALREVYERLSNELPEKAVVQQNPNAVPADMFFGLYADRQTAAETLSCGVGFGGSAALCRDILKPIVKFFAQSGSMNSAQVDVACRQLSIAALVVKDTDGVWKDKTSWVWQKEPLIGNSYSRAFLCPAGDEGDKKP
jgi:hypothetical protein